VQPSEARIDLAKAEAAYRQKVIRAYNDLNFGGLEQSDLFLDTLSLEHIFIRLTLTTEKVIRERAGGAEDKEQLYERITIVQEPTSLAQALSTNLFIVGEPGGGKSTLLRWLAVTFARQKQKESDRLGPNADGDRLPILIELSRLPSRFLKTESNDALNWFQFLPEYISSQTAFADSPHQLFVQALKKGRCLLLFDGLDEVVDQRVRQRLSRSLAELGNSFPGNRIIVGSRPAGISESEGELRPQFRRYQIERFTPEDIKRFFHFWYAQDHLLTPEQQQKAANVLYDKVQSNPSTLQLACTPLLSTILLVIWRNEGTLPLRRVDLYERCCRVLIERWEMHHAIVYQGVFADLGWERHLSFLAPLAMVNHSQEQYTYGRRTELVPWIAKQLQKEGLCIDSITAQNEAEQFLATLSLRSGLLQYMGNDRYRFPHLVFQEYLTARYIAQLPDPDTIEWVMSHLHEPWWKEVQVLIISYLGAGRTGAEKASTLILSILQHSHQSSRRAKSQLSPNWFQSIKHDFSLMIFDQQINAVELAISAYTECIAENLSPSVQAELSHRMTTLIKDTVDDLDLLNKVIERLLKSTTLPQQLKEDVVQVLLKVLGQKNWQVRVVAAQALGYIGEKNRRAITTLQKLLYDEYWFVRKAAVASLKEVSEGDTAVNAALLWAEYDLSDDDWERPWNPSDWDKKTKEMECLVFQRSKTESVEDVLLRVLRDAQEPSLKIAAIRGLETWGKGHPELEATIVQVIVNDTNESVRSHALASLGKEGKNYPEIVAILLGQVLNDDARVRWSAVYYLKEAGVDTLEVATLLLQLAQNDPDSMVRSRAIESLGQMQVGIDHPEIIATLLYIVQNDSNEHTQSTAIKSLGQIGRESPEVVHCLLEISQNNARWESRLAAIESLGQIGMHYSEVV